jgi:predicted nucleic acid-binding protein
MYLLDTNVISELRKAAAGRADASVQRWADATDAAALYLSAITLLECEVGVLRMIRKDPAQGEILRRWLNDWVLPSFAGRILVVDSGIALRCAALHVPVNVSYRDSLIAATAMVHGMTVVTRNVSDFAPMGVAVLNPWKT